MPHTLLKLPRNPHTEAIDSYTNSGSTKTLPAPLAALPAPLAALPESCEFFPAVNSWNFNNAIHSFQRRFFAYSSVLFIFPHFQHYSVFSKFSRFPYSFSFSILPNLFIPPSLECLEWINLECFWKATIKLD